MINQGWNRQTFRACLGMFFFVLQVFAIASLTLAGSLTLQTLAVSAILWPSVIVGRRLGSVYTASYIAAGVHAHSHRTGDDHGNLGNSADSAASSRLGGQLCQDLTHQVVGNVVAHHRPANPLQEDPAQVRTLGLLVQGHRRLYPLYLYIRDAHR